MATEDNIKEISTKVINGTASKDENETYRVWLRQQITSGKAVYDKNADTYTFKIDDSNNVTHSREEYKHYIEGKALSDAKTEAEDQSKTAMTADECYKTIMSGTSNRTDLDKALEYYALHYDEINKIDEQDSSLRYQKGDTKATVKSTVLNDDYMSSKLASIAQQSETFSANVNKGVYGSTGGTNYSKNFLEDFKSSGDSALVTSSNEKAETIRKMLGDATRNFSDQEDFKLPDMGDYYLGNIDSTYLDMISEAYEGKKNAQAAASYAGSAPEKALGYYPEKDIFFLKANVYFSDQDIKDGFIGGDFITILASELSSAKGDTTNALDLFLQNLSSKTEGYPLLAGSNAGNMFEIKLGGITAPQPSRWAYEYNIPKYLVKRQDIDTDKDLSYYTDQNYVVTYSWLNEIVKVKEGSESEVEAVKNCCFLYINDQWHAAEIQREDDNTYDFRWLLDPGYDSLSEKDPSGSEERNSDLREFEGTAKSRAVMKFLNLLKRANNTVYIRFEGCGISPSSSFPAAMSNSLVNTVNKSVLQKMAEGSSHIPISGFNRIHVQNCRRYFGEVYVKTSNYYGGTYINVAKYILGDKTNESVTDAVTKEYIKSSEDYQGHNKFAFKLQQYDIDSKIYADAFFETIDKLDDRKAIQKELFKVDWDDMLNWNVTLGDVTFFVPPVNIRLQTYTHSERMSLMRAKGSMAKTSQRMNRILSMDIFFNEDRGINGYPWNTTLNNSEKTPVTYAMNGLRALVSMFKFTPFLPISNNFINRTLGIDAVVVTALNISSVNDYPKLIHATLTMAEFNWRTYMPDIVQLEAATVKGTAVLERTINEETEPTDVNDEDRLSAKIQSQTQVEKQTTEVTPQVVTEFVKNQKYQNWFEKTINWQTFRYYYQRPIRRGDLLKTLNYDFNSEEYIYYTSGGLTGFVPMDFKDPSIKFYMANEDYLKQILKARYELLRTGTDSSQISFSDSQLEALQAIASLNNDLQTLIVNDKFQQDLAALNEVTHNKTYGTIFSDISDALGNVRPDIYYNQGCITNDMSNNSRLREAVNTVLAQVDQITKSSRSKYNTYFEPNVEYMSIIDKSGKKVSFAIAVKLKQGNMTDDEIAAFKQNLKAYLGSDPLAEQGNWEGPIDNLKDITESRIIIPLSVAVEKGTTLGADTYQVPDTAMFNIDGNTAGMRLISIADQLYDKYSKQGTTGEQVPDVNALMNLVYDEYIVLDDNSPGFMVTNWSATLTNKVAQLHSLSNDGFSPQYLGGEDITFQVNIQTQDKQVATMLTAIPKQISRLTRTYHLVMPCIPMRIESEFSKFLGVNDVTCEEAMISTEPGHPGLYNISMTFISMDRTVRESEAAKKKAINNSGWNYYGDDSISDYGKGVLLGTAVTAIGSVIGIAGAASAGSLSLLGTGAILAASAGVGAIFAGAFLLGGLGHVYSDWKALNSGSMHDQSAGSGVEQSRKYKQYFEMKDALSEQDLYPDLELPTLVEMEAAGFYFTRYKFQDERVYVDPDFYFIYPVKLTSHIYRELAIHGMESGIADTTLTDITGACIKVQPNVRTGFSIVEENDEYKKQVEQSENIRTATKELKAHQKQNSSENLRKTSNVETPFLSLLDLTMERDTWSICDQIQGMFLERKFLKEVKSYENVAFAATASNVNEARGTANAENTETADKAEPAQEAVENQQGEIKNIVHTEGKFIYDELQTIVESAEKCYDWLCESTIESTISSMQPDVEKFINARNASYTGYAVINSVKEAVSAFIAIDNVSTFLTDLKIDVNDSFISLVTNIISAAACASTGRKEFTGNYDSADWKPDSQFMGVQTSTLQNTTGDNEILWGEDRSKWKDYCESVVKTSTEFGCFRFKMYTTKELHNLLYKDEGAVPDKPKEDNLEDGNVNNDHYLLDPGYRKAKVSVIEQYKGKCIASTSYATYAYMRLILYWLCRLVYMRVIPNLSTDILRSRAKLEISIQDTQAKVLGKQNSEVLVRGSGNKLVSLRKYIDFFSKNMYYIDAGKIWTAAVLATSEGDPSIIAAIENRNYDALNAVIETCSAPSSKFEPTLSNKGALTIRKMVLALVGLKVIDSIQVLGVSQTFPAVMSDRDAMDKLYLAAAEDPKQFIPHSFHDMIVNDARGRMLRAFPTFYVTFIDEGREIGFWKLHDNFYNVNAISSIEVIKSRKLPTDVCTIVMSNFFNSFTTEQEDYVRTPVATLEQAWNSIFSPSEYFKEQEVGRRNKPQEIRLRLRQGTRIHVRIGYGNNAAMLPSLFNGVITEISSEDVVKIIAQGDGIELLNPINIDKEAHNLPNEDDFIGYAASNGVTPLQLAEALFTIHGGVIKEAIRERLHLNLSPRNPFGIVHFGDPDFKTFCNKGECCQNLYEMETKPLRSGKVDTSNTFYGMDKIRITFDLFQKTPWDVLNICKSMSPDHKLAVLPFGFRSTVFMGLPHFYYAYDYYKDENNVVKERRKPFQQWHIYTSEQDIIGNGVVATNRDVKTVAIGLFQVCETGNYRSQQKVGPLYADWDIYTEAQKTMVVDTSLLGKGVPFVQGITNLVTTLGIGTFDSGGVDALFDDVGYVASHKKIAWRATANALKDSIMDMYAGDLIVFGDPSVKPQDRMFIADKYSGINGQTLVKEVVHRISVDEGFTTAISPDCITIVNDNTELIKYEALNRIGTIGAVSACVAEDVADSISWASSAGTLAAWAAIGAGTAKLTGVGLTKAGAQAAEWFANSNAGKAGLRGAQSALSWVGSKAGTNIVGRAATSLAARVGAGLALNSVPVLGQAASIAYFAAMTASVLVMPFINAWLEYELKNYKVTTIFPLKKYGYAYTAGFEGARGTVYGSPTWGDRGSLGDVFDFLSDFPIIGSVASVLASDEVKTLASKYIKDANITKDTSYDEEAGRILGHIAGSDTSTFANTYRSNMLQPRATTSMPVAMTNSYNYFKRLDTKNWKADLGENKLISSDIRFTPYIEEHFFVIIHEMPGLPVDGRSVTDENVSIGGKKHRMKAIHTVDGKNNAVVDVPFLHPQALNILYEILRRAKNYMPNANSTDPNENWEITKTDYIVLKSALRIGDRTSMGATGFTFILEGTGSYSQRALKASLENFDAEIKGYKNGKSVIQTDIFKYVQQKNGEISVIVTMPKVSGRRESSESTTEKVNSLNSNTEATTEQQSESNGQQEADTKEENQAEEGEKSDGTSTADTEQDSNTDNL